MTGYDSWLSSRADDYWEPCEPEMDRDGEYTKCLNCFNSGECELWQELRGDYDQ